MFKESPAAVKGPRWTNERHELTERLLESWHCVESSMGFIDYLPKIVGLQTGKLLLRLVTSVQYFKKNLLVWVYRCLCCVFVFFFLCVTFQSFKFFNSSSKSYVISTIFFLIIIFYLLFWTSFKD